RARLLCEAIHLPSLPSRGTPAWFNPAMSLPSGTVTFVFTDVEGSTRLLHQLRDRYGEVVAAQRRLVRDAFQIRGGREIDPQGDAFFDAFPARVTRLRQRSTRSGRSRRTSGRTARR